MVDTCMCEVPSDIVCQKDMELSSGNGTQLEKKKGI